MSLNILTVMWDDSPENQFSLMFYSTSAITAPCTKGKTKPSQLPLSNETWPGLRQLIESFNLPLEYLDDDNWWNATSHAVNGLNMNFLDREFGKIEAYLIEHPRKRPQPRGWKPFMRSWLQNAYEYERKRYGRSS